MGDTIDIDFTLELFDYLSLETEKVKVLDLLLCTGFSKVVFGSTLLRREFLLYRCWGFHFGDTVVTLFT